jgi:hypothetical protein
VKGAMKLAVNGQKINTTKDENGFIILNRTWKTGDVISVQLPMQAKMEYLPDGSPWASFVYGPIVLAAKTDTSNLVGLKADGSRMGHVANGPLYSIDKAPMIISSQSNPELQLKPVNGKPLYFSAANLLYPSSYKNLVLQPFYSIHDARYMVYWRVTDEKGLKQILEKLEQEEKQRLELENNTIDQVAPGEQQSEVDHRFKGDNTETGIFNDKHWRNATGWFGYELKNYQGSGKKLRVTYNGADKASFDIIVNGIVLKKENLDGSQGNTFFDIDYLFPDDVLKSSGEFIEVKFSASGAARMARIFYVRLMK